MSQKSSKAIRQAALKYAQREEQRIAKFQQNEIYNLPFRYRLCYAIGIIFKWGSDGLRKKKEKSHGQKENR